MVLFRVNQVPERLYVHFLNMVGIEPFPPSVARADLTFWLSAVLDTAVVVPAGTQVTTAAGVSSGSPDAVVFTTVDGPASSPRRSCTRPRPITAIDDRVADVWDDLRFDRDGRALLRLRRR